MEFRFRAGDERDPSFPPRSSSSLPDGFFAPQPLRGGFVGGEIGRASDLIHHHPMTMGALRRELQKERIREEIIAREIAERRILEEEVRREMEIERAMGIRRIPLVEQLMMPPPLPVVERFLPRPVAHRLEVGVDEDMPLQVNPMAKVGKEPTLVHDDNYLEETDQPAPAAKVKSAKHKVSGIRRKGAAVEGGSGKVPRPAQQSWSCALCQVSMSSEDGLEDHLQGKKHKTMVAGLASHDTKAKSSGVPTHGTRKVSMIVDGKMHQVLKKSSYLWCEPCTVRCNSTAMMVAHLSGKRHAARMGEVNSDCDPVKTTTSANVSRDESTEADDVKRNT